MLRNTILLFVTATLASAWPAETEANKMTRHMKVVVSSNQFPESGLAILKEKFAVVQANSSNFGEEGATKTARELLQLVQDASALVWCSNLPITKELLDKAGPTLKIVSTTSAGYNHCNVEELRARGIRLSNTPAVLSAAVAEAAVGLMIATARRYTENLDQVKTGKWTIGFNKVLGPGIRGSTVGIIGFGGIGQEVVRKLAGFEVARFLYTGRGAKPQGAQLKAEFVSQDTLLAESDFVVLAVPLTDETRGMINKQAFDKMKCGSVLINVARGEVVNQDDLYDALKSGRLFAAGLDVTTPEPLPRDHKLLTLPNIFILPHIGSATVQARSDMGALAAQNVVAALTGQPLPSGVPL